VNATGAYREQNDHGGLRERPADAFWDDAESGFYAQCVRAFLLRNPSSILLEHPILELGSGTGEAIAEVLSTDQFGGEIIGYELQAETASYAQQVMFDRGVSRYHIVHGDFFQAAPDSDPECVISNPPYLPAPDNKIVVPELWGGPDGSTVMRRLLDGGFNLLVTTLSSFANPVGTLKFAKSRGYRVADFAVRTIPFGAYSSEPKVRGQIERLALDGRGAFISAERYCLAVVVWVRDTGSDLAASLRTAITSLR
jgi:hypothetical protein